jgi:hypothetical protein
VRNNKKSIIIPLLERIGHLELLSIYRLTSVTNQQFFCLAKAPSRKETQFLFYAKCGQTSTNSLRLCGLPAVGRLCEKNQTLYLAGVYPRA